MKITEKSADIKRECDVMSRACNKLSQPSIFLTLSMVLLFLQEPWHPVSGQTLTGVCGGGRGGGNGDGSRGASGKSVRSGLCHHQVRAEAKNRELSEIPLRHVNNSRNNYFSPLAEDAR